MATVQGSTGVGRRAVEALGNKITASVTSQMRGFGRNVVGAAMGQMPGIQAASGYFSQARDSLRDFAGSGSGSSLSNNSMAAMVKEQKQSNIINLQTQREIRGLRNDAAAQSRAEILSSKEISAGVAQVNKTMKEVKETIEEVGAGGGGGGGGKKKGGKAAAAAAALRNPAAAAALAALGIVGGAFTFDWAAKLLTQPNPKNTRSRITGARRIADNVQRRLGKMGEARTSTLSSMYGSSEGGGGGATLKERMGALSVADSEQLKETRKGNIENKKGLKDIAKGIEKVGRNTGYSGIRNIEERRARETKAKIDPREEALNKAWAQFSKDIYKLNEKVITGAIYKNLGYDPRQMVTQAQASGTKYIGSTLSKELGVEKSLEKGFSKLLGKEYGAQYGRAFAQLGEGYLQYYGEKAGSAMFGDTLGEEKARVLTGQILGNLAKGNKQTAMEQLLYGFTGQATGVETVMAKYGFATTGQGIQYMGSNLAAGAQTVLVQITDGRADYAQVRDPRTGKMTTVTGYDSMMNIGTPSSRGDVMSAGVYTPMEGYDIRMPEYDNKGNRGVILAEEGNKLAEQQLYVAQDAIVTNEEGLGAVASGTAAVAKTTAEGAAGQMKVTGEVGQAYIESGQQNTKVIVSAIQASGGRGGGGTSIGVGTGYGNFGNFLVDMGASIVANKLTSGIKNPYVRAAANYGLVTGGKSLFDTFMAGGKGGYLNNLDIALFGQKGLSGITQSLSSGFSGVTNFFTGGNAAAGVASTTSAGVASTAGPLGTGGFYNGGYGSVAGGAAGAPAIGTSAFDPAAFMSSQATGGTAATSAQASAAGSGTMATIGGTMAAIGALYSLSQGDIVGGTGQALIAANMFAAPGTLMANPATFWIGVGLTVLSAFGIGKKKRTPPSNGVHRAMMIEGNNNPAAKETIHFYGSPTPDPGVTQICDEYLNIAFNTIKTFEVKGIKTDPPIIWLQHAAAQRVDGKAGNMWLAVYTTDFNVSSPTDTSSAALVIHFGQPVHASGADAAKIVNELATFYEKNSSTSKVKIDEALKRIRSSAYFELAYTKAKGLEDLEKIEKGLFNENLAESRILAETALAKTKGQALTKAERRSSTDPEGNTTSYETGRTLGYNVLTDKYDIVLADIRTGMTVSSTGAIVTPEVFSFGAQNLKELLSLFTDQEVLEMAHPAYRGYGIGWLRKYPSSWITDSLGKAHGSIDKLNAGLKTKGFESSLKLSSRSSVEPDGTSSGYYSVVGSAAKYASGTQVGDMSNIVAFDPVAQKAIFDVNANKVFDVPDLDAYLKMNPDAATAFGDKAGGIVSIAPSSSDNSTTVNNYGMGMSNAQDPFRNQRANVRPSLVSLAG